MWVPETSLEQLQLWLAGGGSGSLLVTHLDFQSPLGSGRIPLGPPRAGLQRSVWCPCTQGLLAQTSRDPDGFVLAVTSCLTTPHGWHQSQQYCLESSGGKLRQEHQPSRPESTLSIHSQKSQSSGHTVTEFVRSEGKEINLGRSC